MSESPWHKVLAALDELSGAPDEARSGRRRRRGLVGVGIALLTLIGLAHLFRGPGRSSEPPVSPPPAIDRAADPELTSPPVWAEQATRTTPKPLPAFLTPAAPAPAEADPQARPSRFPLEVRTADLEATAVTILNWVRARSGYLISPEPHLLFIKIPGPEAAAFFEAFASEPVPDFEPGSPPAWVTIWLAFVPEER